MIATIIIVALAFFWLLIETDFLRVRLASYEYQKAEQGKAYANDTPYKPAEFTELDIPATIGNLKIICVRE